MRLFAAFLPDETANRKLQEIQNAFRQKGIRGRFTDPANLHMTYVYIGEYDDAEKVWDILCQIPFEPLTLYPAGFDVFKKNIVVLRFQEEEKLNAYVVNLRNTLKENQIPYDPSDFHPHITLIRRADPILPVSADLSALSMKLNSVSLMWSHREDEKLVYTELERLEY